MATAVARIASVGEADAVTSQPSPSGREVDKAASPVLALVRAPPPTSTEPAGQGEEMVAV
jgi:hypothetical protein